MFSLWFDTALLSGGWADSVRLRIQEGRIAEIERDSPLTAEDEHHGAAAPGLSNVHSHAFQRAMAGLTEYRGPATDDFWSWREWMYRFLDRIGPDDVEAIAAQAYVEMLQTGFTRVGEFHYLHYDIDGGAYANLAEMAARIAAAAADTGIGLTLLPVFYAHGGFGGQPPTPGQRRFISSLDGFGRLMEASSAAIANLPDANLGVAPHSLRAVTPEELTSLVALLPSGPFHIHAAEQVKEVDDCLAWSGRTPVAWLLDHMGLDPRWCLIHATHLTADETSNLAASGAVAGLCPGTEANLGDGIFPADSYLSQGGRFGLGTDSNVLIDPAQELRTLEYGQRLTRRARNVLASADKPSTGASLFQGSLAGGARALRQKKFGLEVGATADVVSLNRSHPSLYGRSGDALLDGWIFAGTPGVVTTVWRGGQKVVRHGHHCEAEGIAERYRRTLDKLIAE